MTKTQFSFGQKPSYFFLPKFTLYFDQNPDYILTNIVANSLYFDHFRNSYELLHRLPKSSPIAEMCMDTASYQQILFLICTGSHNLSELSSPSIRCSFIGLKQRKWKWGKARHMSHVMNDCFWLVEIIFFMDFSWREDKALKRSMSCTQYDDNLLCPCTIPNFIQTFGIQFFCFTYLDQPLTLLFGPRVIVCNPRHISKDKDIER